jgi:hypothetical protein
MSISWVSEPCGLIFPTELLQIFKKLPSLNLLISGFGCVGPDSMTSTIEQTFPVSNIVSITGIRDGDWTDRFVVDLQKFLTLSPRLKTLGFSLLPMELFDSNKGRLPPIEHLILPPWPWDYTAEDAERVWDFSCLQELKLPLFVLRNFLKTTRPELLSQLKRLRLGDPDDPPTSTNKDLIDATEFTKRLENLLKDRHDYEVLDIRCLLSSFDMSIIARQGYSLRSLDIWDNGNFRSEAIFSTIKLVDLILIQRACVNLKNLYIGVNLTKHKGQVSFFSGSPVALRILIIS